MEDDARIPVVIDYLLGTDLDGFGYWEQDDREAFAREMLRRIDAK